MGNGPSSEGESINNFWSCCGTQNDGSPHAIKEQTLLLDQNQEQLDRTYSEKGISKNNQKVQQKEKQRKLQINRNDSVGSNQNSIQGVLRLNELDEDLTKTIKPQESLQSAEIELQQKLANNQVWKNASSGKANLLSKYSQNYSSNGGRLESKKSAHLMPCDFVSLNEDIDQIVQSYTHREEIGTGTYGKVIQAFGNSTGRFVALKYKKILDFKKEENDSKLVIDKQLFAHRMAVNEYQILASLDHPNIVKLYEVYHDRASKEICMVTEFIKGKSLFDHLDKRSNFNERETAKIMKQLLQAVHYLHQQGITHNDIKAENVLLTCNGQSPHPTVKIIDFGIARRSDLIKRSKQPLCGTLIYMAPEEINKEPLSLGKVDIWAIGILLFILLTGCIPYKAKDKLTIMEAIRLGKVNKKLLQKKNLSKMTLEFLDFLLDTNQETRPSAFDALQHPWINYLGEKHSFRTIKDQELILYNLQSFNIKYKIQEVFLLYIVQRDLIDSKYQELATDMFRDIDQENLGVVTHSDLVRSLTEWRGYDALEVEVEQIIKNINFDKQGVIKYTEWLVGTLNWNQILQDTTLLKQVFALFDTDNDGYISAKDLQNSFNCEIENASVISAEIINQVSEDGMLCFERYMEILQGYITPGVTKQTSVVTGIKNTTGEMSGLLSSQQFRFGLSTQFKVSAKIQPTSNKFSKELMSKPSMEGNGPFLNV